MPYSVNYSPVEGIIYVVNEGSMCYEDYCNSTIEVVKQMKYHNVHLIFVDCTKLNNKATVIDVNQLPSLYESVGIEKTSRSAYLMDKESPQKRDFRFYETVCLIKGYTLKLFTDRDEALRWLKEN